MIRNVRLGIAQLQVTASKADNLLKTAQVVKKLADKGANIVVLPECFNSPYGTEFFEKYAEQVPGETSSHLSQMAKENNVYLIGGSIPEREGLKLFNTCLVMDPKGKLIFKFRKIHLFDIDIPGKMTFKESSILSAGNKLGILDTEYGKIGLGICYDIRFPYLAQKAAENGCFLMVYPGAFNLTTGPLHWTLLQRARAVDQQMFVAAVSPARDDKASYKAYGHSSVVDPWGKVILQFNEKEAHDVIDLEKESFDSMRTSIPLISQKRYDLDFV